MKHLLATAVLVLSLCALNAAMSCSLTGENGGSTSGIAAPTLLVDGTNIMVSSAPIKDSSYLSTISYANVFRRHADDSNGSNASDWMNIGQVSAASDSTSLREFAFIDSNVSAAYYYSYRVRYFNGDYYVYSGISDWVQNSAGSGTQSISEDVTAFYYRNDQTGEYYLCLTQPSAGFTGIDHTKFESLCIVLHNGSMAKPFALGEIDDNDSLAIDDTMVEMHKILPSSFLDADLTPKGVVLFHSRSDEAKTMNYYSWTEAKDVALNVWQFDDTGSVVFGTATDPSTTQTSFVVPAVAEPDNPFDASSLSLSAKAGENGLVAVSAATVSAADAAVLAASAPVLDLSPLAE